ncbi:hypothetical protein [Nocardiopsis alba]|uniref:hypothetical protein n=1 Tax=Nocardiopsis alba TaxID=53437 RepID=UPI0033D59AC3
MEDSRLRLGEVGLLRLDEYVCGLFAKSSRSLSRLLLEIEVKVYSGGATARDVIWLSYIRFAVSFFMIFTVPLVFGIVGSFVRDVQVELALIISGVAIFAASLRGQFSAAGLLDLGLLFLQGRILAVERGFRFVDLHRRLRFVFPVVSLLLVGYLFVTGGLGVFIGLGV